MDRYRLEIRQVTRHGAVCWQSEVWQGSALVEVFRSRDALTAQSAARTWVESKQGRAAA